MKKLKMLVMAMLAMAMLMQPFEMKGSVEEAQAAKYVEPKLVSLTMEGTAEAYEYATFTAKFENCEVGIDEFELELWAGEEQGDFVGYYYSAWESDDTVISVTDDSITFRLRLAASGYYQVTGVWIYDGAGNEGYQSEDEFNYRFKVEPSSKTIPELMVQMKDICITEGCNNKLDAPAEISFDITAATDKEIKEIELEFNQPDFDDYEDEEYEEYDYDYDEEYYPCIRLIKKLETPWTPGLEGETRTFKFVINGYSDISEYELSFVRFAYDNVYEDYTEYEVWNGKAYGEDANTGCNDEITLDEEINFTIKSNLGRDTVPPAVTSVKCVEKKAFTTTDTITYKFSVSDDKSGIQQIYAFFGTGKEVGPEVELGEYFEYSYGSEDTSNIKEVVMSSSSREEGKYRLKCIEVIDMAGNGVTYTYNSKTKKFTYMPWSSYKTKKVTIKGDLTYIVDNDHKCKLDTGKVTTPASFTEDGIRTRTCTVCGATKEEPVAKVSTATLSTELYTYNGKVKKPTVTLKDENGKKLKSSYYTVTYSKGRKYPGTYTATVKLNKKYGYEGTTKLTFVIQPKAPTSVKAVLTDANAIKVTWKAATKAESYNVYYKNADVEDEEYTLYDGEVGKTGCEITGLDFGVEYDVKVVSCFKPGEELVESTKEAKTNITTLKKVENVTVVKSSSKKVKVSWDNIGGESGYIVTYTYDGKTKTKTVETTKGTSTTISVPANVEVQYQVAAYKKITSKKKVVAENSDIVTFMLEK